MMVTKQELLNILNESLKTEESYLPLYTQHITSTLFLSNFTLDQQSRIQEILARLNSESTMHAQIFKKLIQVIQKRKKDVY